MTGSGTQLGKYRILDKLGAGGMADVYRAEDDQLGRQVALKILPPEFARDEERVRRFEKEVRAAAQLHHPHIVTLFEVGEENGIHFYAMALLPGGDLKQQIVVGINPKQALEWIKALASALDFAHRKGFVHRDIKPENILFDEEQRPLLTDLGIAKAVGSGTKMTGTGMSIGTPHYMSPEQARGKQVDGRSDLYSLGIVLYEMLTGRVPYDAEDTLAVAYSHVNDPLPQLPAALGKLQPLLDRLLAKEPEERFAGAGDLAAAIDQLLAGKKLEQEPARKTQVLKAEKAAPAGKGGGLKWAVGGALLAVLVVGGFLLLNGGMGKKPVFAGGGGAVTPASRLKAAPTKAVALARLVAQPANLSRDDAILQVAGKPKKAKISPLDRLRQQASEALAQKRLTLPEDDSAMGYFRKMLGYDGGRQEAISGLTGIARRYLDWARMALDKDKFDKCKTYLIRFDQVSEILARADRDTVGPLKKERDAISRDRVARLTVPNKTETAPTGVASLWQRAIGQHSKGTTGEVPVSSTDNSLQQEWQRAIQQHSSK
ncbi:hypothetical protein C2E25_17010 [Geothermobacter hydrogeniphilus]|uniref:non-specific serine/threonine protein kinase n=1 Tax=Geothermobacter hydrogeniphilus TaxID=1969733 RepID=A0A2K2H5R3_9BACT|nr:serine/threonine-protein kinase [Geothermobacter hydrogeniphilus]PNU18563.1 hypothetical protein C2E25_17010 [Geothermobacter hydrogeniphilus]